MHIYTGIHIIAMYKVPFIQKDRRAMKKISLQCSICNGIYFVSRFGIKVKNRYQR